MTSSCCVALWSWLNVTRLLLTSWRPLLFPDLHFILCSVSNLSFFPFSHLVSVLIFRLFAAIQVAALCFYSSVLSSLPLFVLSVFSADCRLLVAFQAIWALQLCIPLSHLVEKKFPMVCMCVCLLSSSFGDLLSFTLTAFVELMDHGIISWDTFSVAFIKKVSQENVTLSRARI